MEFSSATEAEASICIPSRISKRPSEALSRSRDTLFRRVSTPPCIFISASEKSENAAAILPAAETRESPQIRISSRVWAMSSIIPPMLSIEEAIFPRAVWISPRAARMAASSRTSTASLKFVSPCRRRVRPLLSALFASRSFSMEARSSSNPSRANVAPFSASPGTISMFSEMTVSPSAILANALDAV